MQQQRQVETGPAGKLIPHRRNEIQTRRFPVEISESRCAELAYLMADLVTTIFHERAEKAAETKVFNDHIKDLEARLKGITSDIGRGKEYKDVKCVIETDLETNTIRFRRVPSGNGRPGKVLKERAMLPDERARAAQGNLPLEGIEVQPVDVDPKEKPEPTRIEPVDSDVDGESAAAGERVEVEFDPGPLCSTCDHPWAWTRGMIAKSQMDDKDRQALKILKVNGHQRSSGKCFVTDCDCKAFMP